MAKIVSMLRNLLTGMNQTSDDGGWLHDPLRHPDLAEMDQRALGDLPMPGFARPRPVAACGGRSALPMQPKARMTVTGEPQRTAC